MRCKRECTGRAFDGEKHLAARKAPRTTIGETTCRCERHALAQTRGVRHSWLGKQVHCPVRSGLPTAITLSPAVCLPLSSYHQRSAYRYHLITSGLPTAFFHTPHCNISNVLISTTLSLVSLAYFRVTRASISLTFSQRRDHRCTNHCIAVWSETLTDCPALVPRHAAPGIGYGPCYQLLDGACRCGHAAHGGDGPC